MHRSAAPSVLSAEAPTQNYRGLFNLGIIILVVSNFRLILSAVRKHGFVLADIPEFGNYSFDKWEQFPFVTGLLATQGFLLVAFLIEYLLAKRGLYEPVGMMLHHINAHTSFAVCIVIVWNFIDQPAVGGVLLLVGAITWMKLISYALANQDYRLSKKGQKKNEDSFQATLAIIDNLDQNDWDIEYPR
jgi:diacylglycerol O-acyltransferase-1